MKCIVIYEYLLDVIKIWLFINILIVVTLIVLKTHRKNVLCCIEGSRQRSEGQSAVDDGHLAQLSSAMTQHFPGKTTTKTKRLTQCLWYYGSWKSGRVMNDEAFYNLWSFLLFWVSFDDLFPIEVYILPAYSNFRSGYVRVRLG